jgi:glycosyltransferase involved in cell wall biosynthesis
MKKVLIIAHFWPYRGGSGRVIGLAKYLPEFGWQPIILTAPLDQKPEPLFRVIETPCPRVLDFLKRLLGFKPGQSIGMQVKQRLGTASERLLMRSFLTFFYNIGLAIVDYPDKYKNWRSFAIKAGNELLQNENIDAMISIWPVTSHIIAKELKAKYKIPWVADFPDLWSQNHNYRYGPMRKLMDRRLELRTIRSADVLTTVSEPWARKLGMLHKRKTVYAITHGFDPAEINIPPANLTNKFTITYTGTIYRGKQDPSKLLAAIQELISNGTIDPNDIEVRFYGRENELIAKGIEEYELWDVAKQYGPVPREISFGKQRESQLLLLLNWEDQREKGVLPLKTFEYLGAQRPVLATGGSGDDVIRELLDETKAGIYCKTVEDIKSVISELYSEYKRKGKVSYNGNIEKINRYSHREMAKKFAEILDSLTLK